MSTKIKEIQERYGDLDIIDMVHQYLKEENKKSQQKRIDEGRLGNSTRLLLVCVNELSFIKCLVIQVKK
ncbi:hypothetical protein AAAC51_06960 [Priestia megaterium]